MKLPVELQNIILDYKQQIELWEQINHHLKNWKAINEQFDAYETMSYGRRRRGKHSLFALNWRFRTDRAVRHIVFDIERSTKLAQIMNF